uniref:Uncharacterized protein n=1 Tax=Strigamia maritima TaxID=126957 RepID=T1IV05_STRMM
MNCGCGNQPFRFCCSVLPDMNESTSTRLMFTFLLFIGVMIKILILSPTAQAALIENFPDLNGTCVTIDMEADCHHVVSYMAIYRLSMALVTFFFLFAIISYGIENSRNCRAGIHNGFWLVKFILLCALCAGALIIPSTHADSFSVAMVMSGMLFFSIFTCGVILMYAEAIHQKNCTLNQIVVGVNLSLCLLSAFISVSPYAEKYTGDARGGLLQSSIISCYILYLSWSAFLNKSSNFTLTNVAIQKDNLYNYCSVGYNDIFTYVGIAMVFLILIYSSTRITRRKEILSATGQHTFSQCQTCCPVLPNLQSEENDGGQRIVRNELQHVVYSYTSWHVLLCLAVMYFTVQLTNWVRPEAILENDDKQHITVWMKIISSWLCLTVYFWLLISACYQHIFKKVVSNTFDSHVIEAQV